MQDQAVSNLNLFGRVSAVLLMLALALANSALFYFVIWDMMQPGQPYTVILFFISGCAHLIYFFLPWFAAQMLGPIFRSPSTNSSQYGSRGPADVAPASSFFVTVCTLFGLALCVSVIGFWALQSGILSKKNAELALITKANCLEIGGATQAIDGKLICLIKDTNISGGAVSTVSRR